MINTAYNENNPTPKGIFMTRTKRFMSFICRNKEVKKTNLFDDLKFEKAFSCFREEFNRPVLK